MGILFSRKPGMRVNNIALTLMVLGWSIATNSFAKTDSDANAELQQAEVETRIKQKLSERLDLFLTPESYRLFVTARVKNTREKVILEGETESNSSAQDSGESAVALPGFREVEAKGEADKEVDRKEKAKYIYRNRSRLEAVSVRLLIDQNTDQVAKDLAKETSRETLALTVGDTAKLEVVEIDLAGKKDPETASLIQWFQDYLFKRGGSALDLLYLSLLVLGTIGLLGYVLVRIFRGLKSSANSPTAAVAGQAKSGDPDESEDNNLDEMINWLMKAPLTTRNFLRSLDLSDKYAILDAINTPALRHYFGKILQTDTDVNRETATKASARVQDKIMTDLRRFIQLDESKQTKPFGFVGQLEGEQIARFITAEKDKLRSLKPLIAYCSPSQVKAVTETLSVDEKVTFLAATHGKNHSLGVECDPKEKDFVEKMEQRLRDFYHIACGEAACDVASHTQIEELFLGADREALAVVKQLASRFGTVPRTYEKYMVTFEDFLQLDLGLARRVLQRVSNDTLARAFSEYQDNKKATELLGKIRGELIFSMQASMAPCSNLEVEDARAEVLKKYRDLMV